MTVKNLKSLLKGFSYSLSDNDLSFICSRLHYNYQGDFAAACDFMEKIDSENADLIRNQIESVDGCKDFYNIFDDIKLSLLKEFERRGGNLFELV